MKICEKEQMNKPLPKLTLAEDFDDERDDPCTRGLSLLQVVVLRLIRRDAENAFGAALKGRISTYREINDSQLYGTIWRLEERGLLTVKERAKKSEKRGAPRKIYEITKRGQAALRLADALLGISR